MRFNTFNEVAKWYEQTKPVVSKYHKAEDNIRPIGERRRKWERIKKVDAETYLLLDGNYVKGTHHNSSPQYDGYEEYEKDMAPIMWKREADGDYIYIRNGTTGSAHVSRYTFLGWYLPSNVAFRKNQQGKHWVFARTPTGWEDFPLPKTNYRWNHNLHVRGVDDGKRLKFRANEDGTFTRIGEAFKVSVATVDKQLKKQWRHAIDAFYIQAAALAPMLDNTWSTRNLHNQTIRDWCELNGTSIPQWGGLNRIPTEVVRQVMEKEDHDLRVPMIALVVDAIGGKRKIESQNDIRSIRAAYMRLMNKLLGMYETREV